MDVLKAFHVATYWVEGRNKPFKSYVRACIATFHPTKPGYMFHRITASSNAQAKKFAQSERAAIEGFGVRVMGAPEPWEFLYMLYDDEGDLAGTYTDHGSALGEAVGQPGYVVHRYRLLPPACPFGKEQVAP